MVDQNRSVALGALLRQRREDLGYSKTQLARAAGVRDSTVLRFEQGKFAAPRPDKLARFAKLLGLSLADLFAWAGYLVPDELPTFSAYLSTKYPDLSDTAVAELLGHFEELITRHGLELKQLVPDLEEQRHDVVGESA